MNVDSVTPGVIQGPHTSAITFMTFDKASPSEKLPVNKNALRTGGNDIDKELRHLSRRSGLK